jgi:hypothetical protein
VHEQPRPSTGRGTEGYPHDPEDEWVTAVLSIIFMSAHETPRPLTGRGTAARRCCCAAAALRAAVAARRARLARGRARVSLYLVAGVRAGLDEI